MIRFLTLLCGLALLTGIGAALAHGAIAKTNPADGSELEIAPENVQVWFDQAIVRGTAELTVINGAGERVDQGEVEYNDNNPSFVQIALKPDLPHGAYIITASATVVSDGHVATGSAVFWIGSRQAATVESRRQSSPAYEILGALIGIMLIAGGLGYWLLFYRTQSLEIQQPAQDVNHFPLE